MICHVKYTLPFRYRHNITTPHYISGFLFYQIYAITYAFFHLHVISLFCVYVEFWGSVYVEFYFVCRGKLLKLVEHSSIQRRNVILSWMPRGMPVSFQT